MTWKKRKQGFQVEEGSVLTVDALWMVVDAVVALYVSAQEIL